MCHRIFLNDHNGDVNAFHAACYAEYLSFWECDPAFQGKRLVRHGGIAEHGWEKTFWSIVEGHDDQRYFDFLERYEKVPCLRYLIDGVASGNADVHWFRKRKDGKIRTEIFSEVHRYLIVLQEKTAGYAFITAHPISSRQLEQKLADCTQARRNPDFIL